MEIALTINGCMLSPSILVDTKYKLRSCWQGELQALSFNDMIGGSPSMYRSSLGKNQ
jgi:hypothetical protein